MNSALLFQVSQQYSRLLTTSFLLSLFLLSPVYSANSIEEQLNEIGAIPNNEVIVVQRKFTRKNLRNEFTPLEVGGMPFGTIRRSLMGGASYTLHLNDWFAVTPLNFVYTKNFFSSFTDDINSNQERSGQSTLKPEYQKLLYFLTGGVQISPFYGKLASMSQWIAYVEPYFLINAGIAKTEAAEYLAVVPGVGLRVFLKEWLSMRFEFRDFIYQERKSVLASATSEQNVLRNNYAITLSLSFWLPKMPQ